MMNVIDLEHFKLLFLSTKLEKAFHKQNKIRNSIFKKKIKYSVTKTNQVS